MSKVQAEATEADKKAITLKAEAAAAAHTEEGPTPSPRDCFEKMSIGLAAVEFLKKGQQGSPLASAKRRQK